MYLTKFKKLLGKKLEYKNGKLYIRLDRNYLKAWYNRKFIFLYNLNNDTLEFFAYNKGCLIFLEKLFR